MAGPISAEAEIEAFMSSYTAAWNEEDIEAIETYYNIPYFSYQEGRLVVWTDADASREADLEWIEVNRRAGPATWERLQSLIAMLGRNSALVTTRWVFRRPDGTDVWDFVDTFHLCRIGDAWRIVARTVHD